MIASRTRMNRLIGGIGVIVLAIALPHGDALAAGDLAGRFYITYQNSKTRGVRQERLAQHYETTFRDRVFRTNDLTLTLFLDNSENLTENLTFRGFRGQLGLRHRYYSFSARVSPRQETTALELNDSRELAQNQFTLSITPPNSPNLRLTYATRDNYVNGAFTGESRDYRADITHRYKFLDFRANHWNAKSGLIRQNETRVTGGRVNAARSLVSWLFVNTGYEFQLTETETNAVRRDVTNHTFTGLLTTRYRNIVNGSLSVIARRLNSEGLVDSRTRNNNVMARASFLPQSPLRFEVSRTYLLTDFGTSRIQSDYATFETLLTGTIREGTTGRAQVSLRSDIDTQGGVVPPNLFTVATRSRLYQGIDLRADVNVSRRRESNQTIKRYQMNSLVELLTQPRRNLTVAPGIQYIKFSDSVGFLRNDRELFTLRLNYFAKSAMTLSLDVSRNRITRGTPRQDTSVVGTMNLRLHKRSSLNVSYGTIDTRAIDGPGTLPLGVSTGSQTLSVQTQMWLSRRGSLSVNYTLADPENMADTSNVAVNFRQDF